MQPDCFDSVNGFTAAIKHGELVDFRPVRQDDWKAIQNGMSALSAKSRYFRFFSAISKLSDAQLHYFTEVDQQDHVAWIALAHDQVGHPSVGIARFIRFPDHPVIAEFAVTVIDSYQKKGLGTLLMAVLYLIARQKGIQILRGFVLPENTVTIHWLTKLGAARKYENGVYRMDIPVYAESASMSTPPLLQYFQNHMSAITPPCKQNPD